MSVIIYGAAQASRQKGVKSASVAALAACGFRSWHIAHSNANQKSATNKQHRPFGEGGGARENPSSLYMCTCRCRIIPGWRREQAAEANRDPRMTCRLSTLKPPYIDYSKSASTSFPRYIIYSNFESTAEAVDGKNTLHDTPCHQKTKFASARDREPKRREQKENPNPRRSQ